MKISELISYIRGVRPEAPATALPDAVIYSFVNEIEGLVQTEVLLLSSADIITYAPSETEDPVLLVAAPHDKIYRAYVSAMVDFANGEYARYQNGMELFNEWWQEFQSWYALRYDPASGRGEERGYYVSAYAIAVKHGFTGTEEEWTSALEASIAAAAEEAAAAGASAAAAKDSAAKAAAALTRAPKIGEGGTWLIWDAATGAYADTGYEAKGADGATGAVGAAGRGISSFAKTGVEAASITSPAQVSDIWRMQYDDRTGVNVKIPRGARWFTCAALEALADSEAVADYAVGAVMGDYLLSTVTGNVWRKAADTGNLWNAIGCIKGAAGAKGDTDADGSPGAKGDKGDTGADGAPGAKGDKGDKGDPGEKGDKGEPGTDAEVTLAKLAELYDGAVAQRALQITDAIPLKQRSGSVMAKVTLQVLRSFVLDSVKAIYNDEGYSAALPDEMGADGVLALVSDIPADFTADEIAALWDAN